VQGHDRRLEQWHEHEDDRLPLERPAESVQDKVRMPTPANSTRKRDNSI
jgi:hypothetical protein